MYGKQICLFYAFCGVLFGICSLPTLTLLSTVCRLKICFPAYAHWGVYGVEPYGTACCFDCHSTNVNAVAMSYTVVLFVFCFILPCGVIVTSYSLILVTVRESRKAVEQHVSGPARMSNTQTITVKLSVAVCIGFFAAWSPYATIAMWAAFGSIDRIPPPAFAVPAVFAKSSTLYNPVIHLLLKLNFQNTITKDFTIFQQLFIRSCFCVKAPQNYRSALNTSLRTFNGKNESSCNSLPVGEERSFLPCEKPSDTSECIQSSPECYQERLSAMECPPQKTASLESNLQAKVRQGSKKSVKVVVPKEKKPLKLIPWKSPQR